MAPVTIRSCSTPSDLAASGRRRGRTLLTRPQAEARHHAIAKLDVRVVGPDVCAWIRGRVWPDRDIDLRVPIQLLGHHLQRAATENA